MEQAVSMAKRVGFSEECLDDVSKKWVVISHASVWRRVEGIV